MITGLVLAASSGVEKYIDYTSLLKILVIGLVVGFVLVGIFSLGLVFLDSTHLRPRDSSVASSTDGATSTATVTRNYPALVGSGLCFLVCVAAGAYGINVILSK